MERWEFKPLESIGNIKFGMARSELHQLLKVKCTEFKKSKFSKNTADDYGGFHVFYTYDDRVDAVEIYEGIKIILDGKQIFPVKAVDIEKLLPGIEKDGSDYTHISKSIGLQVGADRAESILLGAKGYYE